MLKPTITPNPTQPQQNQLKPNIGDNGVDQHSSPMSGDIRPLMSDKYGQSIKGDVLVSGAVNASTILGDGTGMYFNLLHLQEQSADPGDPPEGMSIIWQSDGTAAGDDGDIKIKITAGGSTKTGTLIDFSGI